MAPCAARGRTPGTLPMVRYHQLRCASYRFHMRHAPAHFDRLPDDLPRARGHRAIGATAACLAAALALAAPAVAQTRAVPSRSGGAALASRLRATAPRAPSGTADVAYAGSLEYLNEKIVGPDFTRSTGYGYEGRGSGSDALSQEIASGEITPNVFESVGASPITALEPKFTSWYVQFAASPLVVAYNPSSPYGPQLAAIAAGKRPIRDLFAIMAKPGFALGRTDPNVDPQGAAFVEMIELARPVLHLPVGTVHEILGSGPLGSSSSPEIFDETALEPRLEAGQLDAASAFLSQAVQLHLHYIRLPASIDLGNPADSRSYAKASLRLADGKVVRGAPLVVDVTRIGSSDHAAADAFIAYTLSRRGRSAYRRGGYALLSPTLVGKRAKVPAAVLRELAS